MVVNLGQFVMPHYSGKIVIIPKKKFGIFFQQNSEFTCVLLKKKSIICQKKGDFTIMYETSKIKKYFFFLLFREQKNHVL